MCSAVRFLTPFDLKLDIDSNRLGLKRIFFVIHLLSRVVRVWNMLGEKAFCGLK